VLWPWPHEAHMPAGAAQVVAAPARDKEYLEFRANNDLRAPYRCMRQP
jgi:hypothetical protein